MLSVVTTAAAAAWYSERGSSRAEAPPAVCHAALITSLLLNTPAHCCTVRPHTLSSCSWLLPPVSPPIPSSYLHRPSTAGRCTKPSFNTHPAFSESVHLYRLQCPHHRVITSSLMLCQLSVSVRSRDTIRL